MSVRSFARAAANPVAAIAVAIALVGGTGIATAVTGGTFVLGRGNSATTKTSLTNTAGTALGLTSKAGTPPLTVSNSTKVTRLNADQLDGLDSAALQRRVSGTCAGGAISAIAAGGTVTCAPLPVRVNVTTAYGAQPTPLHTPVATVDGVTFNVACEVYDQEAMEGPRLRMKGYFTSSTAALVNGHAISTPYTMTTVTDPVGVQAPVAGMEAALPELDAPELAFSRQTVVVLVVSGGQVREWTLHLFADGRAFFNNTAGRPCTVWGTVV